jgi:hypothetical protein
MITNKQDIFDNCLIDATATMTTGDDIPHMQGALFFLSEEMSKTLKEELDTQQIKFYTKELK